MSLGRWWRQRRGRLLQLWAVGLVAACAVTGASGMGYLDSLQARALDLGRAIITASRPSEVSIELPELGHGIFTYYLVQGLKGAANLNMTASSRSGSRTSTSSSRCRRSRARLAATSTPS